MQRAKREVGESVEVNWGVQTLALGADGRFRLRTSRPGNPALYQTTGTWSVRADVLSVKSEDPDDAGTTWRYRWTLFHGALVMRKLGVAPTAWVVAPWRRG
jgi:hypothetical protein